MAHQSLKGRVFNIIITLYTCNVAAIFFQCHPYIWSTTVLHDKSAPLQALEFITTTHYVAFNLVSYDC